MSSIALGAAFAAVQLVHQAHSKVKTSRARCARLVERCQFVVDRLERIAATRGGDAITGERIRELEWAFEHTAQTIVHVGQQGIIASLLQLESNAQRIESCNEALTELISLFNLEEIVDVRRWQSDLEVARVRDHRELLSLGQRIESENAAINRELARQGATIAEVLTVIHGINASLQNARSAWEALKVAVPLSDAAGPPAPTPTAGVSFDDDKAAASSSRRLRPPTYTAAATPRPVRTAKKVTDAGTSDGESPTLCAAPCCVSPGGTHSEWTKSKSATTLRRLPKSSFTKKCVKMVPLANVLSKLSSSLSHSTPSQSPSSRGAATKRSNVANSYSPRGGSLSCDDYGDDAVRSSASSSPWCPPPAEPPPPYQLRVANPAPGRDCIESGNAEVGHSPSPAAVSSSRFTTASVEAIRAPDSPVPAFPSPKLSTDSVFGSTQSSISSMSSENGISPRPRCTRRNSAAGARPVLRRRDTIRFARRVTLSSGYPTVKPTT